RQGRAILLPGARRSAPASPAAIRRPVRQLAEPSRPPKTSALPPRRDEKAVMSSRSPFALLSGSHQPGRYLANVRIMADCCRNNAEAGPDLVAFGNIGYIFAG